MNIFRAARDILIPATCVVCGRTLLQHERHICLHCLADMPFTYHRLGGRNAMADAFNALIQRGLQRRAALADDGAWAADGSTEAVSNLEPYAPAAALFYYEGDYANITQALKYGGNVALGRFFASLAAERVLGIADGPAPDSRSSPFRGSPPFSGANVVLPGLARRQSFDAVIPVPLHWRRRFSRGLNQAEVIAREIARHLDVPCRGDILRRRRSTHSQTTLGTDDRLSNVAGAFTARPKALSSLPEQSNLLLIDDVFTTGSTLYACREALLKIRKDFNISILTLAFAHPS